MHEPSHINSGQIQSDDDFAHRVSELLRQRRTTKVLAKPDIPHPAPINDQAFRARIFAAIADAGYAPFHYNRNLGAIAEPWRFHILWGPECRHLSGCLENWFTDIKPSNKLPAMLAACDCLILINWLPQYDKATKVEKQCQVDEEHLAATAAATQNLLLKLTAENLSTYWSSGGFFRSATMFEKLAIPTNEKLLSAIFVHSGEVSESLERIPGKNHSLRSPAEHWTREISLDPK